MCGRGEVGLSAVVKGWVKVEVERFSESTKVKEVILQSLMSHRRALVRADHAAFAL